MLLPKVPIQIASRKSQHPSMDGWEKEQDGIGCWIIKEKIQHHRAMFQWLMEMAFELSENKMLEIKISVLYALL